MQDRVKAAAERGIHCDLCLRPLGLQQHGVGPVSYTHLSQPVEKPGLHKYVDRVSQQAVYKVTVSSIFSVFFDLYRKDDDAEYELTFQKFS